MQKVTIDMADQTLLLEGVLDKVKETSVRTSQTEAAVNSVKELLAEK